LNASSSMAPSANSIDLFGLSVYTIASSLNLLCKMSKLFTGPGGAYLLNHLHKWSPELAQGARGANWAQLLLLVRLRILQWGNTIQRMTPRVGATFVTPAFRILSRWENPERGRDECYLYAVSD
jgi:hypothetical protein